MRRRHYIQQAHFGRLAGASFIGAQAHRETGDHTMESTKEVRLKPRQHERFSVGRTRKVKIATQGKLDDWRPLVVRVRSVGAEIRD